MTVQEFIDHLLLIKDKSKVVVVSGSCAQVPFRWEENALDCAHALVIRT